MYVGRFEVGLRAVVGTLCFLVPQEWVPVVHSFCNFRQEVGRWRQCMYVWLSCELQRCQFDSASSGFLPSLSFSVMSVCELGNDNSMCSCSIKQASKKQ